MSDKEATIVERGETKAVEDVDRPGRIDPRSPDAVQKDNATDEEAEAALEDAPASNDTPPISS